MKLFSELRSHMVKNDCDQKYLAKLLKRSLSYVELRITAKAPWAQDDQYRIMDEFRIPYEQMHIVFPKGGKGKPNLVALDSRGSGHIR